MTGALAADAADVNRDVGQVTRRAAEWRGLAFEGEEDGNRGLVPWGGGRFPWDRGRPARS
jgi:hypothetical protein